VEANLARIDPMLDDLARRGVELAVLPEFFPTGNPLEERVLEAAAATFETVEGWLRRRAAETAMILAGSYVAFEGGRAWNRFSVFEPSGRRAHRHKTSSPAPEALYYQPASPNDLVVETRIGKVGLIMCIEMSEPEVVLADYSECAMVLVCFAIPGALPIPGRILRRLTSVPPQLARRNGVPVVLCSMGGEFVTRGSPVLPMRRRCSYAGKSGIYLPGRSVAGPLGPDEVGTVVADVPLGPAVEPPMPEAEVDCGVPGRVALFDKVMGGRSRRIYERNLRKATGRS